MRTIRIRLTESDHSRRGCFLLHARFTLRTVCWTAAALGGVLALPRARPALARPSVTVTRDVLYGIADGQKLLLDVYEPRAPAVGGRPALIFIHGGSWMGGDKDSYAHLARQLAKEGYVGFSVNYRLATDKGNKYPAQIDDVQRVVRWVRAHAAEYGVDPSRVGSIGESAGGHLSAMLGVIDTRDNSDPALAAYSSRPTCVVDCFGPADFWLTPADKETKAARDVHLKVFGSYKENNPQWFRDASPVNHVDSHTVPFLIFHGTRDTTVHLRQSQELYDVLSNAGVDVTFVPMPGDGHGFHRHSNIRRFNAELREFLARWLHPEAPGERGVRMTAAGTALNRAR